MTILRLGAKSSYYLAYKRRTISGYEYDAYSLDQHPNLYKGDSVSSSVVGGFILHYLVKVEDKTKRYRLSNLSLIPSPHPFIIRLSSLQYRDIASVRCCLLKTEDLFSLHTLWSLQYGPNHEYLFHQIKRNQLPSFSHFHRTARNHLHKVPFFHFHPFLSPVPLLGFLIQ